MGIGCSKSKSKKTLISSTESYRFQILIRNLKLKSSELVAFPLFRITATPFSSFLCKMSSNFLLIPSSLLELILKLFMFFAFS